MPREKRSGRRCGCGAPETILLSDCGCGCGCTGVEEDMPMCRHTNPIPVCECCDCCCDCGGDDCGELLAICKALQEQNRLLAELACAVTGLTSAVLTCCRKEHKEHPADHCC